MWVLIVQRQEINWDNKESKNADNSKKSEQKTILWSEKFNQIFSNYLLSTKNQRASIRLRLMMSQEKWREFIQMSFD